MYYYSPFWGPKAISIVVEPQRALTCRSSTIVVLADSGPFLGLLLTVLGSYIGREQSQFCRFWPVSWTITHCFGVPGAFTYRSSTLAVFVDLTRSMDYYSPFWGPEAISMVVEPQGALTCWSSTIVVLADSGPFLGLLLTVLGS